MTRVIRPTVLTSCLLLVAFPVHASFHLMSISEVMSGFGGDPAIQYVELRMDTAGQNFVNAARLAVFDASGTRTDLAISASDVPVGAIQRKILYATSAFTTATGLTPDFVMAPGITTPTGMVCWGKPFDPSVPGQYIDCVAFGGYTGPPGPPIPPATAFAPGDGALSLTRVSGTVFSKGSSANDFDLRIPGPCNNANQCTVLGATGCGNGNLDPGEACDDGNLVSGDGCENDCTVSLTPAPTPTGTPIPEHGGMLSNPLRGRIRKSHFFEVTLEPVASGLTAPVWAIHAPGVDPKFLFTVDQNGILWRIDVETGAKSIFLDVSGRLVPLGVFGVDTFDERGFLGLAFDPGYATNGLLYTYTSEPVGAQPDFSTMPPATTPNHQSVVAEWHVPNPTDPGAVVDPGSVRVLLRIDEPQFNHNGGGLNFGPDGMLYISLGDGGGADDQDGQPFIGSPVIGHGAEGNGQNTGSALGKMLRIDPHGSNANGQYGIPPDNPFVGRPGFVEEIFAYGLRNPFRFSFDPLTGALYAGDVGQNAIEEVNVIVAGGNYGWRLKEGKFFFDANGTEDGFVTRKNPGAPPDLINPVAQYDHDEGLAIIGGFVYRGTRIPRLVGRYIFGDFARTFNTDGRLFYLRRKEVVSNNRIRRSRVVEFKLVGQDVLGLALLGLGRDAGGELYVLGNGSGVPFGTTGVVLRIGPPN